MLKQHKKVETPRDIKTLQRHFIAHRVPASGSINLTNRCNLSCVHCYLGDRHSSLRSCKNELSTEQWLAIIEQITEAGCLYLLLTGGEVLLRPDFAAIYHKAVTSGLLVTVFSNGTLLNKDVYALFVDMPPQSIEISLYGATPETYEAVTGVKGSFQQCLNGIQGLYEKRIRFKLKTMILTHNHHEMNAIEKIAQGFGVDFRMDPAINACLDGKKNPLRFRVDPADAVKVEFANPERVGKWQEYYNKRKDIPVPAGENLYNCGAGLTNFHIDPDGNLLPCMMLDHPKFDLTGGRFNEGWEKEIINLRSIKAGNSYKCNSCDKRALCSYCPAFFNLESGSPEIHSQYLCGLAESRLEAVTSKLPIEQNHITE